MDNPFLARRKVMEITSNLEVSAVHFRDGVDLDWDDAHVFPEKLYPDVAFLLKRMNELTKGEVAVNNGELVLDIGCGRAIDATEIARGGAICFGLEPSKKMIAHARRYIADNGTNNGTKVCLIQGTGEHLPFKSDAFDKVICKGALDHFSSPVEAIAEMARVLKPGGRAIIAVANFESLGFKLGRSLFALKRMIFRENSVGEDFWKIPEDHNTKLDYALLKNLIKLHLKVERSSGILALTGLPGWSPFLDTLPAFVSSSILRVTDRIGRRFPSLGDVIVLRCSPSRG